MANEFQTRGGTLLENGYLIIPIRNGYKKPALEAWQNTRLNADDLTKFFGCGVGVLCGQGALPIAALDVDTLDVGLASRFTTWCQLNFGMTCERIGQAPKVLLSYRAASEGWGKASSAFYEDPTGKRHRLEVLGRGQQFVAHHLHPDTQQPYEWVDLLGGIMSVRADELPIITAAQVAEALVMFEEMALAAGMKRMIGSAPKLGGVTSRLEDDILMSYSPPVGLKLDDAKRLLTYVDSEDYDTWLKVGMSLHHEYAGAADAVALWDTWSSSASNYAGRESLEIRWEGFGNSDRPSITARWLLKVGNENKREAVRVEKRYTLDEAKAQIRECGDTLILLEDVAHQAGAAAGNDIAIKAELRGLIQEQFKELTGVALPVGEARAAMAGGKKSVARFDGKRRESTEFGNAERLLDRFGEGLMFVPELEAWYLWTSVYWQKAAMVQLEHLAKETIKALPDEAKHIESDAEREAFYTFCSVSQRHAMVGNMVKLAQSDPRVVVPVTELDKHIHLLGVANGAVDLRTGKLLPPTKEHRITIVANIDYDPDAQAPLFEETVGDVFFDDQDLISFFARLMGYSLLGQPDQDVIVIPHGDGCNGKSTVIGAIREALGAHAKMASADTFVTRGSLGSNGGAPREDVLRLRGARLVYISEPDEGSELREGLIKSMTGGEAMPARGMYARTTIEVNPTWVAFLPTNHKPIIKGDDHAIWRRLLLVPFTRNFDTDLTVAKDPERSAKLTAEARGILAWCVRGALAYQQEGLNLPTAVQEAREEYRRDMDLLAEWLDEHCDIGPNQVTTSGELWANWEAYAKARGELRYIASSKSLGRRLQSKGMKPVRNSHGIRGRGMLGIRIRAIEL